MANPIQLTRGELLPGAATAPVTGRATRKLGDQVVYKDDRFYSAFPSIVRRRDGELIVAFRRAPERRLTGAAGVSHTDPNSNLVLVRSRAGGESRSREPELIWAHPEGGPQNPCMVQLSGGSILCASYAWYQMPLVKDAAAAIQRWPDRSPS
ncbi:MAG: hypothetical protein C0504_09885 [Candidatus Solibacter sp.]|nr:hypothetical protein [Candidatus Solibacter sp.]